VFIMDKKKARGYGGIEPFSRIRKELVKEVRGRPRPHACPRLCELGSAEVRFPEQGMPNV
jgi:hypothetical protein